MRISAKRASRRCRYTPRFHVSAARCQRSAHAWCKACRLRCPSPASLRLRSQHFRRCGHGMTPAQLAAAAQWAVGPTSSRSPKILPWSARTHHRSPEQSHHRELSPALWCRRICTPGSTVAREQRFSTSWPHPYRFVRNAHRVVQAMSITAKTSFISSPPCRCP
jgi:hypothetical protein